MRVALVHPFSWPDVRRGGERYLDDLGWVLTRRGHQVDVITGTTGRSSVEHRHGGPTFRRVRHRVPRLVARQGLGEAEMFGAVALAALARRRYDVVQALMPSPALAARLALQPTLYSIIGHPAPGTASATRPALRRLHAAALRTATACSALSVASAAQVEAVFGRTASVLPPGVRLDRFPPDLEPRSGPPVILFSAFAGDRRKGLDGLLAAFAEVLVDHPDACLRLSGAGDHEWALPSVGQRRRAVESSLEVLGPGRLEDVPARYRSATVTVLPARDEAFGLALVESLASGTPAVCTDSGGMPEILDDPRIGRVCPVGDPRALALAINEAIDLARDTATPARCAAHARRWGWEEAVGPAHEAAYESLGQRRR